MITVILWISLYVAAFYSKEISVFCFKKNNRDKLLNLGKGLYTNIIISPLNKNKGDV